MKREDVGPSMSRPEFLIGWLLLTAQPWGKAYRTGAPEAAIQLEFYYRNTSRANAPAWRKVCEQLATGEHWPSISSVKEALKMMNGWVQDGQQQLEQKPKYVECPPEVRARLAKIGVAV